jgi:mannose-6-phosphate isomerase-like protein (cupin superfamily)
MKASLADLLARLPGPVSPGWPEGERFAQAFGHGSMSVELYAPVGIDPQQPHDRDELYVVARGHGVFVRGAAPRSSREPVQAGDVLFVPAREPHRFETFSDDFATWVVFYGPPGGESP